MDLVKISPPYDVADVAAVMGTRVIMDPLASLVEGGHLGKRLTREERERAARSSGTVLLRLPSSNNGRQGT